MSEGFGSNADGDEGAKGAGESHGGMSRVRSGELEGIGDEVEKSAELAFSMHAIRRGEGRLGVGDVW